MPRKSDIRPEGKVRYSDLDDVQQMDVSFCIASKTGDPHEAVHKMLLHYNPEFPIVSIPPKQLWPRHGFDFMEDMVLEYAAQWRDGAEFPPVVIDSEGGRAELCEGVHRTVSATWAKVDRIKAIDIAKREGPMELAGARDLKSTGRETPDDWVWAYHVTAEANLDSIVREGLKPQRHKSALDAPVIFVEPDLEGVDPYYTRGTVVLRFKTPGFGTTKDGESVIFGGSERPDVPPDPPLVGGPGEDGVILAERMQIPRGRHFKWLVQ